MRGGFKRSMQHFAMKGEVDAEETEEREGAARLLTRCDLSIGCSFGPGPGKLELTNNSEAGETE